jgi:hypothetical protein
MSLSGTMNSQGFSTTMGQKTITKADPNLFHKIDILAAELSEVASKLEVLGEECTVIDY